MDLALKEVLARQLSSFDQLLPDPLYLSHLLSLFLQKSHIKSYCSSCSAGRPYDDDALVCPKKQLKPVLCSG
jgi:hypothetical protein